MHETSDLPLRGLRIVVDAPLGAAARVAATLLGHYGAAIEFAKATDVIVGGLITDVVLVGDEAAQRLARAGVDVRDDRTWPDRVVRCAVTVAGLDELGEYPVDELVAQALSGLVDCTGFDRSASFGVGVPIATVAASFIAATSISALIVRRRQTNKDLFADISMRDCCFSVLASTHLPIVLLGRGRPPRIGNRHPAFVPWNTYRASDQWIQICGGVGWTTLCDTFGFSIWVDDPDYIDLAKRAGHVDEIDNAIGAWCATRTAEAAVAELSDRGIPADVVQVPTALPLDNQAAPQRFELGRVEAAPEPVAALERPLSGMLVAEMGLHTAGPLATRVLASLGATVVKLEPPAGDPARQGVTRMAGGDGYLYELNNVDKDSVVVDLRSPAGKNLAESVLDLADVFVQSLGPGYVDNLGLDIDSDRLLRCDISGFDADGPRATDKAFDAVLQALAGVMTLTGTDDRPLKPGGSLTDQLTALGAAAAVAASWAGAPGTVGRIRASLESATTWLVGARHEPGLMTGIRPEFINASDGEVLVRVDREQDRERIHAVIDKATNDERPGAGSGEPREAIVQRLCAAGFIAAPVLGLDEAVQVQDSKATGLLVDVSSATRSARVMGVPLGLAPDLASTLSPAPSLGQNTEAWVARTRKVLQP